MKNIKRFELRVTWDRVAEELAQYDRVFRCSKDIASIARSVIGHFDEEHMIVLLFDGKLKLMGYNLVGKGGVSSVNADPGVIFRIAIHAGSPQIILAHNHPSGNTSPSEEDFHFTNRVCQAAKILGIRILDHVIVGHATDEEHFSMLDAGVLGEGEK